METVWKEVKSVLQKRIPDHIFRIWIEPLKFIKGNQETIFLSSPNCFFKNRINNAYKAIIESEISKILGNKCNVLIEVSKAKSCELQKEVQKKGSNLQLSLPIENVRSNGGRLLQKDFTFAQFVVGSNNDFAYTASLALASRKNTSQNSLFLLSKTGMGKSHLSQAIGHSIISKYPSDRVYYVTADDFTNEMVQSYKQNSISTFKEKYRNNCDVLLVDDVHYLSGKERTQIELALTLDFLYEANKKIIFSSCYLPADIPKLNDKLRSRFSCGVISNIDPPDFRTRVRILQKKSKLNGYNVSEEIIHYLAGTLTENVRQLESGLIGVTAKASLLGVPIDLNLAESVAKNIVRRHKDITIDVIKKLICKQYKISLSEIVSRSRKRNIVRPRQMAIYLARKYTDSPLQVIGKSFNRYHATALHSINTVEREIKENGHFKKQADFFCQKIETGKF